MHLDSGLLQDLLVQVLNPFLSVCPLELVLSQRENRLFVQRSQLLKRIFLPFLLGDKGAQFGRAYHGEKDFDGSSSLFDLLLKSLTLLLPDGALSDERHHHAPLLTFYRRQSRLKLLGQSFVRPFKLVEALSR